jgi:carbohydrate-selective porin OprB
MIRILPIAAALALLIPAVAAAQTQAAPAAVGLGALGKALGGRGDNLLALKMTYWIPVR